MAIPNFYTFFPDMARWVSTRFRQEYRLIVNDDAVPVGIVNPNANGAQGVWGRTPLSQDEIEAPTAAMLQDLGATFQLNEYPYSLYRSDGIRLVAMDDTGGGMYIQPGVNEVWFSPLVVTEENGPLLIEGGLRLIE